MTIDLITADPDTSNPTDFAVQADLAWVQLKAMIPQLNTAIEAFNLNSTTSTSTTSLSSSVASKALTVNTGKSYQPGMSVMISRTSDGTKWMYGDVTAYDSGTGALTVNVRYISATFGPFTDWTISQSGPFLALGDHVVTVSTGNGHGSTNNKIRRFTTTVENTGTKITYADSATLGASFTINENGLYDIYYGEEASAAASSLGVSLNSSQLTTTIAAITAANRVLFAEFGNALNPVPISRVLKLSASDVIRPHGSGINLADGSVHTVFSIRAIGNV